MRVNTRRLVAGLVGVATVAVVALAGSAAHAQTLREGRHADGYYYRAEVESYDGQWGTRVRWTDRASDGRLVTSLSRGDWLRYDDVRAEDFTMTFMCVVGNGPAGVDLGTVEIRLGSRWAKPVATFDIKTYMGPESREWVYAKPIPSGTHTVYLTVARTSWSGSFDLDYVYFSRIAPPPSATC